MAQPTDMRLITVFGGSGFLGRHVVSALLQRNWRVRVAVRRPDLALQPTARVGQIQAVQANLRYPASVAAALRGADAAVNLVGILTPSGRQTFEAVHEYGARAVARAVRDAGIQTLVHVSAIGADANGDAAYARTKALGEAAVRDAVPQAIILRPSILFGPDDDFFNRFAALARISPVLPLIGGGHTRFQPVFAGDVAQAVALAAEGGLAAGGPYELGGPEVRSFRELLAYICKVTGRKRAFVKIPFALARYVPAFATEVASGLSFGLFPKMLVITRDQVAMLKHDNVVSAEAVAAGRSFEALGIDPTPMDTVVPTYLYRFRRAGQFERQPS